MAAAEGKQDDKVEREDEEKDDGADEIQREKYVLIKAEMKQRYRYFLFAHSFVWSPPSTGQRERERESRLQWGEGAWPAAFLIRYENDKPLTT